MTIEELQQNLETWRRNKKSNSDRMPPDYWEAVMKLTRTHPLSEICSKLKLNSTEIKKRMGVKVKSGKEIVFKEFTSLPIQKPELKLAFELSTATGITLKIYQ
jgi:hypothetical protein